MDLEDKLRAYAAKGELVHLSLAFTRETFECVFTAASTAGGHSIGQSTDPVKAIELALESAPVKAPRAKRPTREMEEAAADGGITATVKTGGFSSDWTKP